MRSSEMVGRGPTRHLSRLAVVTWLFFAACFVGGAEDTTWVVGEPEGSLIGTNAQALGSTDPNCFDWTKVDKTLTGGGKFLSPASYNPSGCFKAYRLNLVNYDDRTYNVAAVGYGGAIPTTQPACTGAFVRAYVWERQSNGTMVFVENSHRYGRWVSGPNGVMRCLPPIVNLERDTGIVPNGTRDYRVAMTARTADNTTVPVAFATLDNFAIPPLEQFARVHRYKAALDAVAPGATDSVIQLMWDGRNAYAGQVLCRFTQLDRSLGSFTKPALVKAGANATSVDALNNTLTSIHTALCTAGGTLANFQSGMRTYLTRLEEIRSQLDADLLAQAPLSDGATRQGITANTVGQLNFQAFGQLVSKCGLEPTAVINYVASGTLPVGITDPLRLLLAGCSNQNASQVATTLGFGKPDSGGVANGIQKMARCMMTWRDGLNEDRCNSPHENGAHPPTPPLEQPDCVSKGLRTCTPEELNALVATEAERRAEADAAGVVEIDTVTITAPDEKLAAVEALARQDDRNDLKLGVFGTAVAATGYEIYETLQKEVLSGATAGKLGAKVAGIWLAAVLFAKDLAETATAEQERAYQQKAYEDARAWCVEQGVLDPADCEIDPPIRPEYCPADPMMPEFTWYATGGPGSEHQATKQDLFNHCLCDLVDSEYAAVGDGEPPARAPAAVCPQSLEQRKLACVADPRLSDDPGADDKPDPACHALLSPGPHDPNYWRAKDCELKICPVNQMPFSHSDGECECETVNPTSGTFPNCLMAPRASSGLCTEDAQAPCFCEPIFPFPPNGGDPFCRANPSALPGPLSIWMAPDSDALYLDTFNATTEVLRVRAGGNTQFVSPTLYPNSYAVRGPIIRQQAVLFQTPGVGQNVDFKMYYTNRSKNVFRRFLSQCRMNTFTVGALNNCDFPLPTIDGVNAGTLDDPFELEMELNTAVEYKTRPGFGPISYTGTPINTPTAALAPNCPPPSASNGLGVVNIINPLPEVLDIPFDPNPFYLVPAGQVRIPLDTPVIRELFP